MSFDENRLGELLRMLPPVPAELVARAQQLPAHFAGEPAADEEAAEDDSQAGLQHDHDDIPEEPDIGRDLFGEADSPDDGWS
jgi:hypothetical protein